MLCCIRLFLDMLSVDRSSYTCWYGVIKQTTLKLLWRSIHLFSSAYPGLGCGGRRQYSTAGITLPSNAFLLLLEDPEVFPGQMRFEIPPASVSSQLHVPGKPPTEGSQETSQSDAQTTSTSPFDAKEQRLCSGFPRDVWAPHFISEAEPSHPTEEAHFGSLCLWFHSFGHNPKLMTAGEGRNMDWLKNRKLCLPSQFPLHHTGLVQHPHHCWHRTYPPVQLKLHFTITREQDPSIL